MVENKIKKNSRKKKTKSEKKAKLQANKEKDIEKKKKIKKVVTALALTAGVYGLARTDRGQAVINVSLDRVAQHVLKKFNEDRDRERNKPIPNTAATLKQKVLFGLYKRIPHKFKKP